MPLIGTTMGDYRLEAVIGRGGMSIVYRAENMRLSSLVAVKVLAPELALNDVFRERFIHESRVAASLSHPNVIPIFDAGPYEDLLYIAMRYVAGPDLKSVLREHGALPPEQALLLVSQAGRALDAAHKRGLVHRDVKPANILIERGTDGDPDHVYLADFGITKHALSQSGLTATGQFVGTIDYVAPEQILGKPIDGRCDIYSLGCVLYECLTGRVPFKKEHDAAVIWAQVEEQPPPPSTLLPALPAEIDEVIATSMAKDPDDRYSTCREMCDAASRALNLTAISPTATPAPVSPISAETTAALVPPFQSDPQAPLVPSGAFAETYAGSVPPPSTPPLAQADTPRIAQPPPPPASPRRNRWKLAAVAAVIVTAAALGIAAAFALRGGNGHASSTSTRLTPHPAAKNPILVALAKANTSSDSTGQIPPSTCKTQSSSMVMCTNPTPEMDSASFQTYPSLHILYSQYRARITALAKPQAPALNTGDCQRTSPFGEVGWNHLFQHPRTYSFAKSESGSLGERQLAGRVYCTIVQGGNAEVVWTMNDGMMLGIAIGAPHEDVYRWWRRVHHQITLSGGEMSMGTTTSGMTTTDSMSDTHAAGTTTTGSMGGEMTTGSTSTGSH